MRIEEEIQQRQFESSYQKAMINIFFTEKWLQSKLKESFKAFGITSQQFNVLRILRGKYPQKCTAGEIKEVMLDKTPDLTRLLDRLQGKGWIDREVCEHNRRQLDISITNIGLQKLEEMDPIVRSMSTEMNGLSEEEAEQLSNLLDKLRS